MPSLADLQFLSGVDIFIGLIITAAIIVLLPDWRLALYALIAQYLLSAVLLAQLVQPSAAIVRAISGALAAAILYITLRRVAETQRRSQVPPPNVFVVGFIFRLFALTLVVIAILGISSSLTFLDLSGYVLFSGLWLIAAGLLVTILSRNVMRLGLGILMFTGGFCILESGIEGSLFLYGLLNISDLLLAVVVAHLATLPEDEHKARRRRGETP